MHASTDVGLEVRMNERLKLLALLRAVRALILKFRGRLRRRGSLLGRACAGIAHLGVAVAVD